MTGVVYATVASGMLVAAGVLGTIVPALPGVLLVLVGIVLYGFLTGWDGVAVAITVVATALAVANVIWGIRIPAKETGAIAARRSMWLGALGGVVGFFAIPVVGLPIGWVVGVFLAEVARADVTRARAATAAAVRSFGKAAMLQFAIALGMAMLWGAWATAELFARG